MTDVPVVDAKVTWHESLSSNAVSDLQLNKPAKASLDPSATRSAFHEMSQDISIATRQIAHMDRSVAVFPS
jgi:hypothetical protein